MLNVSAAWWSLILPLSSCSSIFTNKALNEKGFWRPGELTASEPALGCFESGWSTPGSSFVHGNYYKDSQDGHYSLLWRGTGDLLLYGDGNDHPLPFHQLSSSWFSRLVFSPDQPGVPITPRARAGHLVRVSPLFHFQPSMSLENTIKRLVKLLVLVDYDYL